MRIRVLFYVCFLILVWFSRAAAQQNINFTSLTTKEGLSSNRVNVIQKDHYGLMWFGTEDGLNKFDGTNFTVYRRTSDDSAGLKANEILALHEDKAGNLWIGTGGASLSLYDRQKDAFIHFPADGGSNTIDNGVILSICSDYRGKLWIGHYNGINILDPQTKTITKFYTAPGKAFTKTSSYVFEDSQRQIWIGTKEGLYRFNRSTNTLTAFLHTLNDPSSIASSTIISITEDKQKHIWIGTNAGVSMLQPDGKSFINYKREEANPNSLGNNLVSALAVDDENRLWIATGAGLDILDIPTGKFSHFTYDPRNVHSLNTNSLKSIYIDRQGIYWIGNYNGGINKYDKNLNLFNLVRSNPFDERGLNAPIVTSFAQAGNGNIFVGTDGGGVSLFDPKTNTFRRFEMYSRQQSTKNHLAVMSLAMTRNKKLLVGTYSDGLFELDPVNGAYRQYMQGVNANEVNSNDIFCITEDRKGNRWIGTNGEGINVLNSENKVITRYTPNPAASTDVLLPVNGFIRDIIEDRNGNFWIATHGGGIARFQPASGKFTIYKTSNSKLPNDKVLSLLEDSRGNIWAGTLGGGLGLFNPVTNQFTVISEMEGLLNNNVYKILEDQNRLLWISTNKGLSNYNPATKKINNYNYSYGIQQNNFVYGSGLRASGGFLYFGGLDGFNFFNPDLLKKNNNVPSVLITDLKISNKSVAPSEDGPIKESISIADKINLDYKQNFALSFVGLNYTAPEQNQYAYKLEGFDKDWNYVGSSTTAVYTNLDPGDYVFRVRASNNDGVWNTEGTSIKIYVHPPFWRTIYAYMFYILVIAVSGLYHRYRSIQKIRRKYILEQEKARAEQERIEAERLRELDQLKIKFLTNLSHEFRTPISLILGPVDMLISQEKNGRTSDQLSMIKRNGKRLLNLVNQLLDFRKMEENELKLNVLEGELVSFVKEVFDSFKDLAERKKIDFVFTSHINHFPTCFDHDKIERILFNLLSNAFKFTLEGGKINFEIEKHEKPSDPKTTWITIRVKDSGIGIPQDKKEKIFERFFQNSTVASILNQGSGIGLSITKEFVKMQGGTIEVESEVGKGTTFLIQLPFSPMEVSKENGRLQKEHLEPEIVAEEKEWVAEARTEVGVKKRPEMPSVLLVEDNEDFRFYLKDNLRLQYRVFEAANGKEGWQKALAEHPQLIVSDISMPYMDGIELCRKIKLDKRTSHIPVILLTALSGEEDQIRGLETGANDYVTKPFNFEVLNAKIKNLLVLNQSFKDTYTKQIKVSSAEVQVESADEKLMQNIMLYIEENLTDTQLSVENLSRHVGMSRSSLYSKLVELSGQTPVEFIRSVKLDKAAALLEKSDMTIAQIAYSVGFSTPNYFSRSFKEKFNMLPSEYISKMRKKGGNKVS
jgi:signal transduction histidine kinase/ligand-binding sensor domain-containing protein/DNA-binding response OmpR family regulator